MYGLRRCVQHVLTYSANCRGMCAYPKCFHTTAPFLGSAHALSLECRGRDVVNSIRNFSNNMATLYVMYSEPFSAWNSRMTHGTLSISCRMTGSK